MPKSFSPPTADVHLVPEQAAPPSQIPYFYTEPDALLCGTSLWLVQVRCPSHEPSQLLVHLLCGQREPLKCP